MREIVCHWFRASVCSGHIPYHKCCSAYVIGVQIAFHITHYSTPHNIRHFRTRHTLFHHITPKILHHTTFHVAPPFTSHHSPPHHSTSYHHCTSFSHHPTTYHIPRHISQTFNVTTRLASDHHILHYDITRQSASHHYFTPPHLEDRTTYCMHITRPQSTSHTIPHPPL